MIYKKWIALCIFAGIAPYAWHFVTCDVLLGDCSFSDAKYNFGTNEDPFLLSDGFVEFVGITVLAVILGLLTIGIYHAVKAIQRFVCKRVLSNP